MEHFRQHKRSAAPKLAALALLTGLSAASSAQAVTLFSEDFEPYTFSCGLFGCSDNAGIAKITEGASEVWYGARFEDTANGNGTQSSINDDLSVQYDGGGSNTSHTGRVADDAGLVFKVSTVGYNSVALNFDWRTFQTETTDRLVVGYHVGPIADFGGDFAGPACAGNGEAGCYADLRSGSTTAGNAWGGWTELMRVSSSNSWSAASFDLTATAGNSEVWVAFWMDNGNGDYAKFDNVLVTATPVPEADTYAMLLAGLGLVGYTVSRRKRSFS